MKPRLIKRYGLWFCEWGLIYGRGVTPITAYNDWLKDAYPYDWGKRIIRE